MESVGERIARAQDREERGHPRSQLLPAQGVGHRQYVDDSPGLSIKATEVDADAIVFCGVTFMAKTAKILNPDKTVLITDSTAVCSMAQMCSPEQIIAAREANMGKGMVGYVNSTVVCRAEMDACCALFNTVDIVFLLESEGAVLVPGGNLGCCAAVPLPREGGRPLERALPHLLVHLRPTSPQAQRGPPERRGHGAPRVQDRDHEHGQRNRIHREDGYLLRSLARGRVHRTHQIGMRHRVERKCTGKRFRFLEYAVCSVMKMVTMESVAGVLETMGNEVVLFEGIMVRARRPVKRMIDRS